MLDMLDIKTGTSLELENEAQTAYDIIHTLILDEELESAELALHRATLPAAWREELEELLTVTAQIIAKDDMAYDEWKDNQD